MRNDISVEYPKQTRIKGDIQQLDPDHAVNELWQVLTGSKKGRTSEDQITVFDGVGFVVEDFSATRWLHQKATDGAPSEMLDLFADPHDPKDLLGMIRRCTHRAVQAA